MPHPGEARAAKAHTMKLHPFNKVIIQCEALAREGKLFYLQFLCAKCNTKQTIDQPNTLYTSGICQECHHITDLKQSGCNYLLIATNKPEFLLRIDTTWWQEEGAYWHKAMTHHLSNNNLTIATLAQKKSAACYAEARALMHIGV